MKNAGQLGIFHALNAIHGYAGGHEKVYVHRKQRKPRGVAYDFGQLQLLVGGVGVAAPAAALAQPGVFADAAQPGVQAAAPLEAVDVEEGLVEGLLEQLLRLSFVAGQRQEEPVDRSAVGVIQFFKAPHGHSSFPMMP